MAKKQFYGIKYPFTSQESENYFVDTNANLKEQARSILMHVIFTPKGQKLRDPNFGTDLIKYIFEPNDRISWNEIKSEIQESVRKYLPNLTINEIKVLENEEEISEIYVRLDYTVSDGIVSLSDSFVTTI